MSVIRSPDDLCATRKSQGATQGELAGLHDLGRYTVVGVESGKGDPKLSTNLTLLGGLGISLVAVPSHLAHRLTLPPPEITHEEQDLDDWEPDMDTFPLRAVS